MIQQTAVTTIQLTDLQPDTVHATCKQSYTVSGQWSFRGGTRGNTVPIVKITLERMGTAFPSPC